MQSLRQASSRLATQRETHRFKRALQLRGAPLVARSQTGQALTEGLARTGGIHAAKPSRMQAHADRRRSQRQIHQDPHEVTMGTTRTALAIGTPRGPSGGDEIHADLVANDGQRVQAQPGPLRRDTGKERGNAHE